LGLNAATAVFNPTLLAGKVQAVLGSYGSSQAAAPVVSGMLTLGTGYYDPGVTAPAGPLPSRARDSIDAPAPILSVGRQREADNAAAFQRLVRSSALVEVALAVPGL